jgi:hypothetical protein
MTTSNMVLAAIAVASFVLYLMRRRARLNIED